MRLEYTKHERLNYNKIKITDADKPYFWSGTHKNSKEFLENFCKIAYKLQSENLVPTTDEEKEVESILKRAPINIYCNNLDIPLTVEDGRHRMYCFKELNLPYKFPIKYNLEFEPLKEYNLNGKSVKLFDDFLKIFNHKKKIDDKNLYTIALPNINEVKEILESAGLEPVIAKEYNGNKNYLIVDTRKLSLDEILEIIPIDEDNSLTTIGKNETIDYEDR